MKTIIIKSIPHAQQEYPTVGNYWIDFLGRRQIAVSSMKDWRYELLVAVHELIEVSLVEKRSISERKITEFDIKFEEERAKGKHTKTAEPGDDKKAPYYKEHQFATKVEKMLAKELGVNWAYYDKYVGEL